MCQRVARDREGILAAGAVKIGVMAIPLAAGPKFDNGEIPGDSHWDNALFARLERKPHYDRARKRLTAAYPRIFSIAEAAVFRKGRPDGFAVALGFECCFVGDFYAGRFER